MLQVEKDENNPDISKVKAAHIRAVDFEPFAFRINGEALPELLDGYRFKEKEPGKGRRGKFDPNKDISEQQHRIALEAAFTLKDEYGYKELAGVLRDALRLCGRHTWRKQGDRPHYPIEEQTDDSAGERQEIHLQARFPLLAVWHGNHFTLVTYHIYTEIK